MKNKNRLESLTDVFNTFMRRKKEAEDYSETPRVASSINDTSIIVQKVHEGHAIILNRPAREGDKDEVFPGFNVQDGRAELLVYLSNDTARELTMLMVKYWVQRMYQTPKLNK